MSKMVIVVTGCHGETRGTITVEGDIALSWLGRVIRAAKFSTKAKAKIAEAKEDTLKALREFRVDFANDAEFMAAVFLGQRADLYALLNGICVLNTALGLDALDGLVSRKKKG